MSNQLMDMLENKVFSAVDTIENLRSEIHGLKEERRILEDKLRELIQKIDTLSASTSTDSGDGPSHAISTPFLSPFGSQR